jgi:hypothetical protein
MKQHAQQIEQSLPVAVTPWLVLRAYFELLRVDAQLAWGGFSVVYEKVRSSQARKDRYKAQTETDICRAVDLACVFYFKEVRCLQRSAATTTLLRRSGFCAEMVLGVQTCPYRAHAWVELAGRVVNDKPYTPAMYTVMDRC